MCHFSKIEAYVGKRTEDVISLSLSSYNFHTWVEENTFALRSLLCCGMRSTCECCAIELIVIVTAGRLDFS